MKILTNDQYNFMKEQIRILRNQNKDLRAENTKLKLENSQLLLKEAGEILDFPNSDHKPIWPVDIFY